MNDAPTTPQGYGPPPFPPPPHAGYSPPPRKNNTKWILIVVLLVIGLPLLLVVLFAVAGVLFFAGVRESGPAVAPAPQVRTSPAEDAPIPKVAEPALAVDRWHCIRAIDGDTIEVKQGDKTERVRLLCIDTPERGKPGFDEATAALAALVKGRGVDIVRDPKHDERDRYGRLLAYVIRSDPDDGIEQLGMNANVEMVRLGHSTYYTKYGKSSMFAAEFEAAGRK